MEGVPDIPKAARENYIAAVDKEIEELKVVAEGLSIDVATIQTKVLGAEAPTTCEKEGQEGSAGSWFLICRKKLHSLKNLLNETAEAAQKIRSEFDYK